MIYIEMQLFISANENVCVRVFSSFCFGGLVNHA